MKNSDQKSAEKIAKNPKKLRGEFFKSEGFKIFAVVLFFTIFLAVVLPFFFDNSALKFQISQKVSRIAGANFTIGKRVRDVYNRSTVSGVIFDAPTGPEVMAPPSPEGYFQTQVRLTFETFEDL